MKAYFIKSPLQNTGKCKVTQEVLQVTQKRHCLENNSHILRGKVRKKTVVYKSINLIGMITVAPTSGMLCNLTNTLSIHSCHSIQTAGLNHGATPGIPTLIHWAGPQWQKEIFTTRSNNNEQRAVTPWMGVDEAWSYFFPHLPGSNRSPTTTTFSISDTSAKNGRLAGLRAQNRALTQRSQISSTSPTPASDHAGRVREWEGATSSPYLARKSHDRIGLWTPCQGLKKIGEGERKYLGACWGKQLRMNTPTFYCCPRDKHVFTISFWEGNKHMKQEFFVKFLRGQCIAVIGFSQGLVCIGGPHVQTALSEEGDQQQL